MPVQGGPLKPSDFVHLHNHSHYSLLDGLQKVPDMVSRVRELGMNAVALTDHGTLSGAIEFYNQAKSNEVNPLIGIESYVAARKHTDKDPTKDKARYHIILIAMNNIGYKNLMKLSTIANLEGFYHKPRIDRDLLEQYNEGLIVLSGCIGSEVGDAFRNNQDEQAFETIKWYKKIFGDRYFLEVQDHAHQWKEQDKVNKKILKAGIDLDIDVVVTADAHYLKHEDQEAHEILLCVQTGAFLSEEKRMSLKDTDLYLTNPEDIIERWKDNPEVIQNTKKIANMCNVELKLGEILIPKFEVPKGKTEKSYLEELVYQGLAWRYGSKTRQESRTITKEESKKMIDQKYLERTEYELKVIESMGFSGYFLIVQDFINWGKDKGIVFGPGRGSAAGSIVSYALNITELDPLKYDLLFERFLNPDRISMPDIDIDIRDSRRDEVIEYCIEKYGQERVAHIVTFGTMATRNAIRDVARVLEVPYAQADTLAKLVPPPVQGRHIPLEVSIKEDKDLAEEYNSNNTSKRVIDLAIKLEGTIRSHGVHAAGVVIAPEEITNYAPLELAQKGVVTTQYSMNPIEELGLLKMDFLGLSNLTIIKNALRIIKKVYQNDIDISSISLEDPDVYALLGRGETTGVFQLESAGMKRYIKQLQPTRFEDIVAMVALYRPGPMQFIEEFIARKHGIKKIEYVHQKMEDALENTYGILVYQEQVMQIAKDMCGFTGGQADTLRKAIGKKIATLLAKMKADFVQGGINHSGASKDLMEKFWKQLEDFAAYCFNKSHAASYGLIAYWTAYLKAKYPDAFMAALMTSDYDDTDRLAIEIAECTHMGIAVLPPDINESFLEFAVVPKLNQIRFGLSAVKNVGTAAVEEIINERDKNGHFKSIEDFVKRVNTRVVNRKTWESLIKAGAFDAFNKRSVLLNNLEGILSYGQKLQKEALSGQTDLFSESGLTQNIEINLSLVDSEEVTDHEKLQWERELLGIYISKHPLDDCEKILSEKVVAINEIGHYKDESKVKVGGLIKTVREITTKNGDSMAFVLLEDKTSEIECIVFPRVFEETKEIWKTDSVVMVNGTLNKKDRSGKETDELKVLVKKSELITFETAKNYKATGKKAKVAPNMVEKNVIGNEIPRRLYVHLKDPNDNERLLQLKKILIDYPGTTDTILVIGEKNKKSAIKLPFGVSETKELLDKVAGLFSPDCVAIK